MPKMIGIPPGVKLGVSFDQSVYIRQSIKNLIEQAIRDYEHRALLELVQLSGEDPVGPHLRLDIVTGQHLAVKAGAALAVEAIGRLEAGKAGGFEIGGAAIGAIAGQILGKSTKATVIGGAVGAAAGAGAAAATANYEGCVNSGGKITATLNSSTQVNI